MKTKVCILSGGDSVEREVSLRSAHNLLDNINKNKYDAYIKKIEKSDRGDWINSLAEDKPDIILSTLHGGKGENGAVQGLLECMGIPYVGSKVTASALGMNKKVFKELMKYNSIPVAEDIFVKKDEEIELFRQSVENMGYPVIVKPNNGGSSIGISIAEDFEELRLAADIIKDLDDDILIERYIKGKEVTCCVTENENGLDVLPLLEIKTGSRFYDFNEKYNDEQRRVELSTMPDFLQTMIKEIAKKVFNILDCRGYANVEMIVREEQICVIEINTLPGMTKKSPLPKAAEILENGFGTFIERLIEFELHKK
ncbi:MAG: D-alanine--D-alanine ligase [Firmicutes bacterium]|nr:D-alanine--D-alanine ligase [Bacillota bacterium]